MISLCQLRARVCKKLYELVNRAIVQRTRAHQRGGSDSGERVCRRVSLLARSRRRPTLELALNLRFASRPFAIALQFSSALVGMMNDCLGQTRARARAHLHTNTCKFARIGVTRGGDARGSSATQNTKLERVRGMQSAAAPNHHSNWQTTLERPRVAPLLQLAASSSSISPASKPSIAISINKIS